MSTDWVRVILNPSAAQGRARGRLSEIERALASHGGKHEILVTHGPGHATELARRARAEGVSVLGVVGGDGTLNEVVQAYVGDDGEPLTGPDLALIPCGTGGDFKKTLGASSSPAEAVRRMLDGARREIDLGVVRFEPHPGQAPVRGFVNVASFGLSGAVDAVVKQAPAWLGGKAAFFAATLRAMASYSNPSVRVRVDGALWFEGATMTVAIGNGRYFGGGMMIAPHADPSDGKLAVVSLGDLTRLQAIGLTSKIYQGTHVAVHGVTVTTGITVEAEPMHAWATVLLDIDGEQPGKLPMIARVHRGALTFRV